MLMLIAILLMSCGSTKNKVKLEDITKVKTIIENDTIRIEADWAYPQNAALMSNTGLLPVGSSGGSINLIGNPNYLIKKGDSLSIELPYYGEQRMGAGYNSSNNGISFSGKPEETEYIFSADKNTHEYLFNVNRKSENLNIRVIIYPNLKTEIRVNSSHRTSISYKGNVIEKENN